MNWKKTKNVVNGTTSVVNKRHYVRVKSIFTSEEDSNFGNADGVIAPKLVLNDDVSERVGSLVETQSCSCRGGESFHVLDVAVLLEHRSCHCWIFVGQTDHESGHALLCCNDSKKKFELHTSIYCKFAAQQAAQQIKMGDFTLWLNFRWANSRSESSV